MCENFSRWRHGTYEWSASGSAQRETQIPPSSFALSYSSLLDGGKSPPYPVTRSFADLIYDDRLMANIDFALYWNSLNE